MKKMYLMTILVCTLLNGCAKYDPIIDTKGKSKFETSNASGEDRIVRATIPATVKASLAMPFELQRANFEKRFSTKRVTFGNEQTGFDVNVSDAPSGGY